MKMGLWAALPMAQTSQVESRLKLILNNARNRRSLSRRVLFTALGLGAVVLVPLAMLHPIAKAQGADAIAAVAVPPDGLRVELASITDSLGPDRKPWGVEGNPVLTIHVNNSAQYPHFSVPPGQRSLFFSFRLPAANSKSAAQFEVQGAAPGGLSMSRPATHGKPPGIMMRMQGMIINSEGLDTVAAALPTSLTKTTIRAGIASGPWTETVDCPKMPGKVRISRPAGDVIFTLLRHTRVQDGAVFMVTDHFRSHSPLTAQNDLQVGLHDGENYQRSVFALDRAGHVLQEIGTSGLTWPDEAGHIKTMQTAHIPADLLHRAAAFRLVARPYQWVEFKDVSLQPVK